MKEKIEKKPDVLEDVKEVDRKIRAKILYKKIGDIKEWAKEIATLKEKTELLLEELGVEKEDIKRLIDYATNSPEAQLTDADKKDLRETVKKEVIKFKDKAKEKIDDMPIIDYPQASSIGYAMTATNWITDATGNAISYTLK